MIVPDVVNDVVKRTMVVVVVTMDGSDGHRSDSDLSSSLLLWSGTWMIWIVRVWTLCHVVVMVVVGMTFVETRVVVSKMSFPTKWIWLCSDSYCYYYCCCYDY